MLWILRLRNRTAKTLHLTFPSTQYADVLVRRRGKTVYAWSRGRGFFTAISHRTLGPREMFACTLGPDPIELESLEQGRYELFSFVNAYRPQPWSLMPIEARGWFSVP